jgi:hypothetical protein
MKIRNPVMKARKSQRFQGAWLRGRFLLERGRLGAEFFERLDKLGSSLERDSCKMASFGEKP